MPSPLEVLAKLDEEKIIDYVKNLSDEEILKKINSWEFYARDEQLPPNDIDWSVWLLLAGRGFG